MTARGPHTNGAGATPERILVVHNRYQQPGGEDVVVAAETALLRSRGHEVITYERSNDDIRTMGAGRVLLDTFWSRRSYSELSDLIGETRPSLMHCHNTFPLISPSVYWAAGRHGVPVVQTLHNFRLVCPQAMLLRDGQICEACVGRLPVAAVRHGCYRQSRANSSVVAGMLAVHRGIDTYGRKIAHYIALNSFARQKFIEGGIAADKITVKPNFTDWPSPASTSRTGFLFAGRLSSEKGIEVLARALPLVEGARVRVAGSGPEAGAVSSIEAVTMLGHLSADGLHAEMTGAEALILPSIWYEAGQPMVAIEAYAAGLPVIASRLGALPAVVTDGETGLLFEPGDAEGLAACMRWAMAHPGEMAEMGRKARARYEAEFTPERNYEYLTAIYRDAMSAPKSPGALQS